MARPSKLTPMQWADVERRAAEGESLTDIARSYGVAISTISAKVSGVTETVRKVAHQVAQAQTALAELPPRHQMLAINLADKLRNISESLACAAELGAKTAHRLQHLANTQVSKVDDADPMQSIAALRDVGVLTKLANDSSSIALNLLAANKDMANKVNAPQPEAPSVDTSKLSAQALRELMAARRANQ